MAGSRSSTRAPRSHRRTSGGATPHDNHRSLRDPDVTSTTDAAGDPYAESRSTTEGRVYTVSGGDWDAFAAEAAELAEGSLVVNMGPQHPSTHGVLRLILQLEGETVTDTRCGIGYLHTGIEKNLEFRTWTQGVTFVTRMDYLSPFFNETAYCMGVERLLGITDEVPERARLIRILMMELNRISSHLVCIATGGMEIGALTVMTIGFRERELVLDLFELITGLRMNHAYVRPGGVANDLPADGIEKIRDFHTLMSKRVFDYVKLCNENPIFKGRLVDVGYPRPGRLHGARDHRSRSSGRPACHGTSARPSPTSGTTSSTSTFPPGTPATPTDGSASDSTRWCESLRIVEQVVDRLEEAGPGPVMVDDPKIAWPAQLSIGSDGQGNSRAHINKIMNESMEALIHHFKLVTEGFSVPAGQVYSAVESPRGELGVVHGQRWGNQAVPRPLSRPVVHQPASGRCHVRGRSDRRRHRRRRLDRPRHGRRRPLIPIHELPRGHPWPSLRTPGRRCARCSIAYPRKRSALMPLLHLVQADDGHISPEGLRLVAELIELSEAEVTAVSTFYTMYLKRESGRVRVGVCINSLCAVLGGDEIWEALVDHCGVGSNQTTDDGAVTLERIECQAACTHAPVMTANWEFLDDMTVEKAKQVVDDARAGRPISSTRGPVVRSFPDAERTIAAVDDQLTADGDHRDDRMLAGLRLARENGDADRSDAMQRRAAER